MNFECIYYTLAAAVLWELLVDDENMALDMMQAVRSCS